MRRFLRYLLTIVLLTTHTALSQAQSLRAAESRMDVIAGKQATFVMNLSESYQDYNAISFNMKLPKNGFHLVGAPTVSDIWKSTVYIPRNSYQTDTLSMPIFDMSEMDEDGQITMAFASADSIPGTTADGLLTFQLSVDGNVLPGDSLINFDNIWFEYAPMGKDKAYNTWFTVSVILPGDFYRDDLVNTTDIIHVIDYILKQRLPQRYSLAAADMNEDKIIDIFDVMRIVSSASDWRGYTSTATSRDIHNATQQARLSTLTDLSHITDSIFIDNFSIEQGESKELFINLTKDSDYAAFQFDLRLPDGISIDEYSAGGILPRKVSLVMEQQEDKSYRFIAVPRKDDYMYDHGGDIIHLKVSASKQIKSGEYIGYFRNIKLSSTDGTGSHYDVMSFPIGVTEPDPVNAVNGITGEGMRSHNIYNLSGQKVQQPTSKQKLSKGLYVIDGKKSVVK